MPLYRSLAPSPRAPRSTSSPKPDPPPRAVRRISTTFPTTFGRSYRTRESGARRRTIRPRGGVDAVRDPRLHGLPANRQQNGRRAPNRFARVCLSSLLPILRDSAYILLLRRGLPPLPSPVARRSTLSPYRRRVIPLSLSSSPRRSCYPPLYASGCPLSFLCLDSVSLFLALHRCRYIVVFAHSSSPTYFPSFLSFFLLSLSLSLC